MSDPTAPRIDGSEEDALERLVAERPEPTPAVLDAMVELEAARSAAAESLDELASATQSALDVPAKIRRNPGKTVALAGGAGFLMFGGPRRVARFLANQVRPPVRDPHDGLLPDEIERVLRDTGVADDPEVRRALDEDFAEYLEKKGRYGPTPGPATSFWRTFDQVAGPLGTVGARLMVQRIMEAEHHRAEVRTGAREQRLKGR
jgi:hypothetical protein